MTRLQNTPQDQIDALYAGQRAFFATGKTRDTAFRKEQLRSFEAGLRKWEKPLCDALQEDLHKSYEEAYLTELSLVYGEISSARRHLRKWTRRKRVPTPAALFPSRSHILHEPLGCTLIVSPWNYPVQLLLSPLVGAISAGCTALLKPSPYVPNVSSVLEQFLSDTFDSGLVAVVQGSREVNTALFEKRFDLVFLTGSPSLGKAVMQAQAKYLTPLVLELGGKSPCIVDKDADLRIAARRIAWGKSLNAGQTCIAPDYLFLHEDIRERFVALFKEELQRLYPEGTKEARHYVHIVREEAWERITGYLAAGRILAGGRSDRKSRWIEPTLLDDVDADAPVMSDEIFGPVFPVMTFRDRNEVVRFIGARENPLAFYYFGREKDGWDLLSKTTSGGACINDTIMHIVNPNLPFGGVGNAGMGSYHGERSFLAFSHERSIVTSPVWPDLPFRYMPYRFLSLVKRIL